MKLHKLLAALAVLCLSSQTAWLPLQAAEGELAQDGTGIPAVQDEETPAEPEPAEPAEPELPAEPEPDTEEPQPDQPADIDPEPEPETPAPEDPVEPEPEIPAQDPEPEDASEQASAYEPAAPDTAGPAATGPYVPLRVYNTMEDARLELPGFAAIHVLPDFTSEKAWLRSSSPYNTPALWGQCTWFAWGRFYEIYGFDPGFTGNGNQCVDQLLNAHPDLFERSETPAAGAVFSSDYAHNHVGIVLAYDETTGLMLIQEGNFDGVSNPIWNDAIRDWKTSVVTAEVLQSAYGQVVYANPRINADHPENTPKVFRDRAKKLKDTDFGSLKTFDFEDFGTDWNGQRLNRVTGTVNGPSGKETYYNLPMEGVLEIMRSMGNQEVYWVRGDGCKMLGRYIMVAADLRVHPRGSLVQTSLGMGIVCDTGEFALSNPYQIDIAVAW